MTNNLAGRKVRVMLVGDNVFDQLSYARVKNCEVYDSFLKASRLATLSFTDEVPQFNQSKVVLVLSIGTQDAAEQTPIEQYQLQLTEFCWSLLRGNQKFDFLTSFDLVYLKPRLSSKFPPSFQAQLAKYIGITYYTLISHFPKTILTTLDGKTNFVKEMLKNLLHDVDKVRNVSEIPMIDDALFQKLNIISDRKISDAEIEWKHAGDNFASSSSSSSRTSSNEKLTVNHKTLVDTDSEISFDKKFKAGRTTNPNELKRYREPRLAALYISFYHLPRETNKIIVKSGGQAKIIESERLTMHPNFIDPIRLRVLPNDNDEVLEFFSDQQDHENEKPLAVLKVPLLVRDFDHLMELNKKGSKLRVLCVSQDSIKHEVSFNIGLKGIKSNALMNNFASNMQVYLSVSVADSEIHQYQTIYRSEVVAISKHSDLFEFKSFNVHQRRLPEDHPFIIQVQTWPGNQVIAFSQIEDVGQFCETEDNVPNGRSVKKFPVSLKNSIDNSAKIVLLRTQYMF